MPNPPLPDVLPCEELVEEADGSVVDVEGVRCGEDARVEYLRRPMLDNKPAWVAVCDAHADARERQGLIVRPFTGISRW